MQFLNCVASSGAIRQEKRFQTIANNLSNTQTAGFKKETLLFETLLLSKTSNRLENRNGDVTKTLFHQGDIQKTERELDLAIEGMGFFKVKTPYGIRYTRAGNFRLNQDRALTDANGFPVMGRSGEIRLNGQPIVVEPNGAIKVNGNEVDRITPVTFHDLTMMKKEGHTLFILETPQEEIEADQSQILQGHLELSNVNSIEEMVRLIDSLRTFESCLKVIQSQDEINGRAVNDLGKV